MDLVDFTTAKFRKTRKLEERSKFSLTFYESVRRAFTHNLYQVNWLKNKDGLAPLSSGGYRTIFLVRSGARRQKIESPDAQIALTERGFAESALPLCRCGLWGGGRYNRRMRRLLLLLATCAIAFAQKKPFDVNALLELKRIGDPQISPDGKLVAFTVQTVDVAANKKPVQVWVVALEGGGAPRQITQDGESNQRPRWSPDSKRIAYVSDRGGSSQIWLMDPDGGNAKQVTNLVTEADGQLFSPDGKSLVFTSQVYPECGADDACNQKLLDAEKASKVKARIYTDLLYRHWTGWQGKRRSHILVMPAAGGAARDLTPGTRDVPPFSLGGMDDYDISPNSQELCYSMISDATPATSTDSDLYVVSMAGGQPVKITIGMGADANPRYSPDGKYLAWRAQQRPGYESDRWRLTTLERSTGKVTNLTESLDRWVNSFTWSPDSGSIFFTTNDRGRQAIQMIPAAGGAAQDGGKRRQRTGRHAVDAQRPDDGLHAAIRCLAGGNLSRQFGRRRRRFR